MFHKPNRVSESCFGWQYCQKLPKGCEKQLWLFSRWCSIFQKYRLSSQSVWCKGVLHAGGVLPFTWTAKLRLALLIMPCVSQKRTTISYLGLFQQSLPQFFLQFRQCYSAKLNAYGRVNTRTFFQGSNFVKSTEDVLPAKGIWRPGSKWKQKRAQSVILTVVQCWTVSTGAALGGSLLWKCSGRLSKLTLVQIACA